jgi:hypothetical protein
MRFQNSANDSLSTQRGFPFNLPDGHRQRKQRQGTHTGSGALHLITRLLTSYRRINVGNAEVESHRS